MEHSSGRKGREYEQQPEWSIVLGERGGEYEQQPEWSIVLGERGGSMNSRLNGA